MRALPVIAALAGLGFATAAGAQRATHWSYQPIARPAVPDAGADWAASPVDRFAARAMAAQGLVPSAPADPAVWLRRVTLDLTGLPPTPAEVDAFVADASPAARRQVVDALMARDAFAERWAQWWLDLARFADSQGYEKDKLRRGMWRYRDWVIDAFRADMPFDRFTIEQLAGDLLDEPTDEQLLATAFHRNTMNNTEGGTDDEEFRVAAVIDRVDTTLSVWMGSTLGCAQCHDHKYDPFSQREFFELFAFFDQTQDADTDDDAPTMRLPTAAQREQGAQVGRELERLRAELGRGANDGPVLGGWHLLGPVKGATFEDARDRVFAPERGVQLDGEQEGLRWQPRDFADGRVHGWRGDDSAFYLYRTITASAPEDVTLSLGSDDSLAVWWNGEEVLRKDVARGAKPDQERVSVRLRAGENEVLLKVTNGGSVGGFCFELWGEGEAATRERIAALEAQRAELLGPLVPILRELPPDARRTTRVHIRGSFLDQGDVVHPDTPDVWPPFGDGRRDRLGFARWLMARDNPLTARVLANRVWSELFGRGVVATLEDFGAMGEPPSHPALLDWLACEFVESGWSLRHLLRTIVLSATYGQSSRVTPEATERDPHNVWLARGPAFRLSAEQLRDQALAVAGLLERRVGGPSVMPPQPDGVWRQIYSGEKWVEATGGDRYRRALYTFWRRTSPHPAMLVFDAQSREACVLKRQRTNTPLQALVLWNDPQFHEPARALARQALARDGEDQGRVAWLWRQCLLRAPSPPETQRLCDLLEQERRADADEPLAWTVLASVVLCLDEFVTRR